MMRGLYRIVTVFFLATEQCPRGHQARALARTVSDEPTVSTSPTQTPARATIAARCPSIRAAQRLSVCVPVGPSGAWAPSGRAPATAVAGRRGFRPPSCCPKAQSAREKGGAVKNRGREKKGAKRPRFSSSPRFLFASRFSCFRSARQPCANGSTGSSHYHGPSGLWNKRTLAWLSANLNQAVLFALPLPRGSTRRGRGFRSKNIRVHSHHPWSNSFFILHSSFFIWHHPAANASARFTDIAFILHLLAFPHR
jgi:hypothetical protein